MNYNLRTAFTLIELLVVIAIIGILSGLIIVGMSSSVSSANIAKSQIFSASLKDSLLMNLVSEWRFDDSANLGKDTWGNNNCSNVGAPVQSVSGCIDENCISFNGTLNYLSCTNSSSLQITGDQTIEMWLYPTNLTARRNPYNKAYGGEGTITQEINGTLNYYYGTSGSDTGPFQSFNSVASIQANKWHHIVATRSLSTSPMTIKWFINGVMTASVTASYTAATVSSAPILIGNGYTSPYYGKIDNVRIYGATVSASQIQEQFYVGLNRLLAKGEINKEEYLYGIR